VQRERKVVTVLFADLVGFTARAESLDPEDVEAILRPYHDRLRFELERHGGTVEKFIGDAVMALFGAPLAHEDDPERAVRAALAIRDWAREEGELEVRVGITTGEALVSLDARPESGEGMASGDIVNTAARLQAAAPVNGILVDETTYRATERPIEHREAAAVEAKGKSLPVPVWEPVEARSLLEVDVRSPRTPLVGRRREVDVLVDALARVREERAPQLVTIVGAPGIGKSRLVYELFQAIDAEPGLTYWRQGRSLPYGEGVSFWSLGEIVKAQAGIKETDPPAAAEEKLRAAVASMDNPEWLLRHLGPLVGVGAEVELGPECEEAFGAWRQFFEELADERPLVLAFEDLHWADEGVLDFVDHLVDWAAAVPILVVVNARPELLERRPDWGGGKRNATTISLSPLTDADTAALVDSLTSDLPAETQLVLLKRAGGNPLYAEEFARMLAERGETEEVPETLQGVIAARLDGLPPEEKALLQEAAVVGRVFWLGAVEAMDGSLSRELEARLHALARKEFIRRERRSSVEGDTEFAFLHVLVRDVAYGQLPRRERSEKHRLAAEWIASLGGSEDHAEMLGHHYLQALELAEAAGADTSPLVEPARRALVDAGDRAGALYSVEAAKRFYQAALRLCSEDGPERARLLYKRAVPVGPHISGGDPMELAEARDALLATGDPVTAALVEALIAQAVWIQGREDLADEHGRRALELLGDAPPSASSAWVLARRAATALVQFDHDEAARLGKQALGVAEQAGWDEGVSDALATIGAARVQSGDLEGIEDTERAVEVARSAGAVGASSRALNSLAVANQLRGDLEAAYTVRLEAAQVGKRLGNPHNDAWFESILSDHRYRLGEWGDALRRAEAAIDLEEAGTTTNAIVQAHIVRGEIRVARDDIAGAVADADRALEIADSIGVGAQPLFFVLSSAPHLLVEADSARAAEVASSFLDEFSRGKPLGFTVINLPMFAFAAVRLGLGDQVARGLPLQYATPWREIARAVVAGDLVEAAESLARASSRPDEAEARLRAAEKLLAEGRRDEADKQLRRALELYRSFGATRYVREAEALLVGAESA
jgi:class 3 adenylate cyclase/tetratricopeptide (TPR) repeat protein